MPNEGGPQSTPEKEAKESLGIQPEPSQAVKPPFIDESDILSIESCQVTEGCRAHFAESKDGTLFVSIETHGVNVVLLTESTFLHVGRAYAIYKKRKKAKQRLILPGDPP